MKRIYVTGGNGFLGKAVVRALASHADVAQVVSMTCDRPRRLRDWPR